MSPRGLVMVALAVSVALPLSGQRRRQAPKAFPLSVSGSLVLNSYGTRAQEVDAVILQCGNQNCIDHGFGKGPGFGVELQVPLVGTLGMAFGMDALSMLRRQCIPGGNCATSDRVFGLRARGEVLIRLKASAPIFFGLGAAAMRTDPGALEPQANPTVAVGPVFTIGGDFAAGSRTRVRIAWHSFFLRADDTDLPSTFSTGTAHDGVITIGARFILVP